MSINDTDFYSPSYLLPIEQAVQRLVALQQRLLLGEYLLLLLRHGLVRLQTDWLGQLWQVPHTLEKLLARLILLDVNLPAKMKNLLCSEAV